MTQQQMRAVVVHAANDLRVDSLPVPVPSPGEVLVDVEWGGICGSDLAYVSRGISGTAALEAPLVLGHEIAGRVVALGEGVDGIDVGTAAAIHPATLVADGTMEPRLAGRTNLYPMIRYFGSAAMVPHTDGGMCEYVSVRADQIVPLPEGLDARRGALAEPLAVALHAINRAADALTGGIRGRTILVNGAGPIGLLLVAAAKRQGADRIIAADLDAGALERAELVGASATVRVGHEPMPEEIELTFEASGSPRAIGPVLAATARGGVIVQVGNLPASPTESALGQLVTREINWIGSYRFVGEMQHAVQLLADGLDVDPVVSHEFGLSEALDAFRVAGDPTSGASKVLLNMDA